MATASRSFGQTLWSIYRRAFPRRLTRPESAEVKLAQQEAKESHQIANELRNEARRYAHIISDTLADLNICYRYRKDERDLEMSRIKKVAFKKPFVHTREAIYLEVDLRPQRRPRGIGVSQLADPDVLMNLSINCGHKVLAKYSAENGFWYIVEREYGVRGIPSHVKYHAILAARPASADGLALPLGIGENKKPIYRSLGQMYSMMIAGTIGGGKSNILNAMICTLIRTNSPKRLKFILIDLKGGVEFAFYEGVPHLLPIDVRDEDAEEPKTVTIIDRREHVPKALNYLIHEGERRMGLLRESRCKGIGEYNFQHRAHPLPHICCVIDEWADVKLDREIGARSEEKLINIASRFRAAGIHVMLCTQVPKKEVIDMRIKNVLPARLAFACPDIHASMLILGDGKAHGLEPAGRAIFQWGSQTFEMQTPFISNQLVDETVEGAKSGQFNDVDSTTHDVTDQELLEWAISENSGKLDHRSLFAKFRTRGIQDREVRAIVESLVGTTVVIGSTAYTVEKGSGPVPTRLLPVSDKDDDAIP